MSAPKFSAWLWPDHNIGKRESRRLRDDHNALYNSHDRLTKALALIAGSAGFAGGPYAGELAKIAADALAKEAA